MPQAQIAYVDIYNDDCIFPAILQAYDAVAGWITANGHQIAESPREIWHSGPTDDNRHMEIAWPYR